MAEQQMFGKYFDELVGALDWASKEYVARKDKGRSSVYQSVAIGLDSLRRILYNHVYGSTDDVAFSKLADTIDYYMRKEASGKASDAASVLEMIAGRISKETLRAKDAMRNKDYRFRKEEIFLLE